MHANIQKCLIKYIRVTLNVTLEGHVDNIDISYGDKTFLTELVERCRINFGVGLRISCV